MLCPSGSAGAAVAGQVSSGLAPLSGGTAAAAPAPASPPGGAALPGAQRFCRSLRFSSIFMVRRGAKCRDIWSGLRAGGLGAALQVALLH